MARDPFARASQSVLRRLGKDALLRGAPAGRVHVEHNVEAYERHNDGEARVLRSVATVEKQYDPKNGDALVLLDDAGAPLEAYTLQGLFEDNGYTVRRIAMKAAL